jgi:hypothetical protein
MQSVRFKSRQISRCVFLEVAAMRGLITQALGLRNICPELQCHCQFTQPQLRCKVGPLYNPAIRKNLTYLHNRHNPVHVRVTDVFNFATYLTSVNLGSSVGIPIRLLTEKSVNSLFLSRQE